MLKQSLALPTQKSNFVSIRIDNMEEKTVKDVIKKLREKKTYKCLDKLTTSQLNFLGYVTWKTLRAVTSVHEEKDLTIKQKDFYKHIVDIASCIIDPKTRFKLPENKVKNSSRVESNRPSDKSQRLKKIK